MNLSLSEAGRRIIDAVIAAPVAWPSPGELADQLGWDLEATLDAIADLDADGWLEAWDAGDGPVVTLSVAATAGCGVRLVEVGAEETPRWARSGDPDPPGLRASGVFRSVKAAAMGLVADSRPTAENAAILAEEAENRAKVEPVADPARRVAIDRLPRPTLLIGGGLSPWPGPTQGRGPTCPACRSVELSPLAYCLWCDRWGLDLAMGVLEPGQARSKPDRTSPRVADPEAMMQKLKIERRKRRKKRKERLVAEKSRTSLAMNPLTPSPPAQAEPMAG